MSLKTDILEGIIEVGKAVSENDDIKSTIFGSYADGKPRSLSDAIKGEVLSPKQKKKVADYKKAKKKKKKKKKSLVL